MIILIAFACTVLILESLQTQKANPFSCPDCNIILISIDTLRADHLSLYGYQHDTSPTLDKLAENSIVFENCIAQAPWTLPSHMSMLTGLYLSNHGVVNDTLSLSDKTLTLADILHDTGYTTAAFTDSQFVSKKYNYHTFDVFNDEGSGESRNFEDMIEWVSTNSEKKFFLFWHNFKPHCPYNPEARHDKFTDKGYSGIINTKPGREDEICEHVSNKTRKGCTNKCGYYYDALMGNLTTSDIDYVRNKYDGEIRETDAKLKQLLTLLVHKGLLNKTIIVFTSDHGETLGDRSPYKFGHKNMHREVLNVPLVIHAPYMRDQSRVGEIVESIDIMPTLLDLVGLSIPEGLDGVSLVGAGSNLSGEEIGFSEYYVDDGVTVVYALRYGDLKIIHDANLGSFSIYNLSTDPRETTNIYDNDEEKSQFIRDLLLRYIPDDQVEADEINISDEAMDRLAQLGYI